MYMYVRYLDYTFQLDHALELHFLSFGRVHVSGFKAVPESRHVQQLDVIKALLQMRLNLDVVALE